MASTAARKNSAGSASIWRTGTDIPALVVQEDFSCHGSPCWETVRTLTEDPAEIQQYMAFRDVLRIIQQRDREERLPAKQRTGDSFPEHPPRQGGRSRER